MTDTEKEILNNLNNLFQQLPKEKQTALFWMAKGMEAVKDGQKAKVV